MNRTFLHDHLSEAEIIAIVEAFGGTRLYIPVAAKDDNHIVQAVGREAYQKLATAFAPDVIRVPLCREMRVLHYRSQGLSSGKIASRLCITEPSVNRIVARAKALGMAVPISRVNGVRPNPTP